MLRKWTRAIFLVMNVWLHLRQSHRPCSDCCGFELCRVAGSSPIVDVDTVILDYTVGVMMGFVRVIGL
jgi:hypothetical protein